MTCSERNLGEEAEMTTTRGSKSEIELRNGCGNPGRVKEHWRRYVLLIVQQLFTSSRGFFFVVVASPSIQKMGPVVCTRCSMLIPHYSRLSRCPGGGLLSRLGSFRSVRSLFFLFFCINPYTDTPWSSAGVYLHYFTPAPVAGRSLFRCSPVGGWRFALFRGVRLIIAGFPLAGKEGKKQALGPRGVVMRF